VLTFKKSLELQEVAAKLPLKNIILETDSPFLTPEPYRGKEENEPIFVCEVLKKLQ
jgi:TatD DNase family protein